MAVLLENQAKQLLDEATSTGTTANSEEWSGVALPLLRRIFGEIAAKEFVSVQPMNLPSGLIFYLDFKYGTATAGRATTESLFGGNSTDLGSTDAAVKGLYGDGRFGYSVNEASATVATGNATSASATWAEVGFDGALSASVAAGDITKLTIAKHKSVLLLTKMVLTHSSFQVLVLQLTLLLTTHSMVLTSTYSSQVLLLISTVTH